MFLKKKLTVFALILPLFSAGSVFAADSVQPERQMTEVNKVGKKGASQARENSLMMQKHQIPAKRQFMMGGNGIYAPPSQRCAHVRVCDTYDINGKCILWLWDEFC